MRGRVVSLFARAREKALFVGIKRERLWSQTKATHDSRKKKEQRRAFFIGCKVILFLNIFYNTRALSLSSLHLYASFSSSSRSLERKTRASRRCRRLLSYVVFYGIYFTSFYYSSVATVPPKSATALSLSSSALFTPRRTRSLRCTWCTNPSIWHRWLRR